MLSLTSLPCPWSSLSPVHSLCAFITAVCLSSFLCAYCVATHTDKKEVVVAIRGTWAVENVVMDITALPVVISVICP